ncbi:acetolactate decarboxylase [Pseudoclavibacter sp. 13-3]|uniref:acetolactate decarboxylase n=1 Tax=Pseudoclavibacter sp. 13-3 TaxID=2901228 RepID=UPI001E55F9C5|nr:acetolactate decarboxylase [Pseudoclavibacter sp. 13-3]MCD7101800.1 acetolactate decarboxylase [Pseudoclavibacter sp. 13-3]
MTTSSDIADSTPTRPAKRVSNHIVRHEVFQTSLMSALLDGIYDGEMTIAELLGQGSFGLGTFDGLDGEMIILDGHCWQMRVDGSVQRAPLDARTPFAVVTNFVTSLSAEVKPHSSRDDVSALVDSLTVSPNYLYALRITGEFDWVKTRTVQLQSKPYPRMVDATNDEPTLRFENVHGVVGGFRTPVYEQGISVPGCHVHFIDDDRTKGGHVLDFQMAKGTVEVCLGTDLRLSLPRTEAFEEANLSPEDLHEELHRTESHK